MAEFLQFLRSVEAEMFFATFIGGFFAGLAFITAWCRWIERRERKRKIKHPYLFQ